MSALTSSRVLVVDDDLIVLEIVRERLEGAGFEVSVKESSLGISALLTTSKRPALILLDLKMPGLSGVGLARLEALKKTPIVFHSSQPQEELDALAKRLGVLGAIQKTSNAALFLEKFQALWKSIP
jgi:CheY-like chemotaxis protein